MSTEIRIDNDDESLLPEGEYKIEMTRVIQQADKVIFYVKIIAQRVNVHGLQYWKYTGRMGV